MNKYNIPINNKNILNSEIHRLAFASDASFYRLIPEIVIQPKNDYDIITLFNYCKNNNAYLTFRAAGTSLSGQSLTEGILVDLSNFQKKLSILEDGKIVECSPNIIAGSINAKLKKYSRILGPDPASINACTIGGIIANNSSGMRSGIIRNAYNTTNKIKFILPNGYVVNNFDANASLNFSHYCPNVYQSIIKIKKEIDNDKDLIELITYKNAIKTTVGYAINAFLDFDEPLDIISHLMVGSEGTLGFISEISIKTFQDFDNKLTGILFFANTYEACKAILPIKSTGVTALEFLDYKSLISIASKASDLIDIQSLPYDSAALLFEFQESDIYIIDSKFTLLKQIISQVNLIREPIISELKAEQEKIWMIRKGLLASLGSSRKSGTTFILEDICIPVEVFEYAIPYLQSLFIKCGYSETGIYGHGMDGNVHFMLTENFDSSESIVKYADFMNNLAELVVRKYKGTLKAEHGTGRNIAPFVEYEWGEKAYSLMKRIKNVIDPYSILNRGVLINDDKQIHIKNFKSYPVIHSETDKCIECGFCENICPSRNFTFSPRKRIVLERELKRKSSILNNRYFLKDYQYYSVDTCALDGLCAEACPVGINTGNMIKSIRNKSNSKFTNILAVSTAKNFKSFEYILGNLLSLFELVKKIVSIEKINSIIDLAFNLKILPQKYKLNKFIGKPVKLISATNNNPDYIYFVCCVTRMMGKPNNESSLSSVIINLAEKAGIEILIPENISNYCCGTIFSSKGYDEAYRISINSLVEWIWRVSLEGLKPIIFDSTSCYFTIINCEASLDDSNHYKWQRMKFIDSTEFIADKLINKLTTVKKYKNVVLHPTCSSIKLTLDKKLKIIAENYAENVIVPLSSNCCGMAGDRGLIYPDLNISATKQETDEISMIDADGYYSTNIPCEVGMSVASGKEYRSIAYLVRDCTR